MTEKKLYHPTSSFYRDVVTRQGLVPGYDVPTFPILKRIVGILIHASTDLNDYKTTASMLLQEERQEPELLVIDDMKAACRPEHFERVKRFYGMVKGLMEKIKPEDPNDPGSDLYHLCFAAKGFLEQTWNGQYPIAVEVNMDPALLGAARPVMRNNGDIPRLSTGEFLAVSRGAMQRPEGMHMQYGVRDPIGLDKIVSYNACGAELLLQ